MAGARLSVSEEDGPGVPPPLPPDDPEAWYAPGVLAQYEPFPDVVATLREARDGFAYEVREPGLSPAGEAALERVEDHFADASLDRPLTREGTVERMEAGFDPKYRRVVSRLTDLSAAARRRVEYHALCSLRCLGDLTPLALDDVIEVADVEDRHVVVHTTDYAPAVTDIEAPGDEAYLSAFASERIDRYTVDFHEFSVPVVLYREQVLGTDPFTTKYAVLEPDLLPGDEALIEECKERIWEASVDGVLDDRAGFVRERAREVLSRRLTARNTRAWVETTRHRAREALAAYDLAMPPVDSRYATDRLDDLVYYVLRDFVGHGQLTVPIRDGRLEDIEANRVGERVKVVPRADVGEGRIPTDLTFEDEAAFVNVVTQLAAADGVELSATNPSAKVNVDLADADETIRCAVALPVISDGGPHISIRKQAREALTPVELVDRGVLPTELVTLLWMLYEHHAVVLFSGPTGVGKTTLMNAHMPFVPYADRPISLDEGSREVRLPHETGVSLTTREHEHEYKRVTMADLMTESNYLNPDIEVIAEINTPASFETFAETLNTGHGVIGTTHAEDVEKLVNRVVEQGLPAYLLRELDLVVFPRHVDGERYVGRAIEFLTEDQFRSLDSGDGCGRIRKDDTTIYWNAVLERTEAGRFRSALDALTNGDASDDEAERAFVLARIADRTDRPRQAVEREFQRKHGYVEYLQRDGVTDFGELFEFLADLRTNEAATVERASRHAPGDDTRDSRGDTAVSIGSDSARVQDVESEDWGEGQ